MNHLVRLGFSAPFLIRVPSSVADLVTTLLIFEMLRVRRSLRVATASALLVACSPVLFIISGFHGNTDPVFVMFTLLSAYLLINRPWPALAWMSSALAGVAFALAVSVKLVPVVVLPTLLLLAARLGRRQLASFVVGAGLVMLPLWGPVVLRQWQPFRTEVLGVHGDQPAPMGARRVRQPAACPGERDHLPPRPGTLPHGADQRPAACAVALLAPRRGTGRDRPPLRCIPSAQPCLRHPVPGVAGCRRLSHRLPAATAYNLSAGAILAEVYNRWNGGLPWNVARATPFVPKEVAAGLQ